MTDRKLRHLHQLVGRWSTRASHPAFPGVVVQGTVVVEWLEGDTFLIHRARTDHADFPDSISIVGNTDQDRVDGTPRAKTGAGESRLSMHYFDSRGVFRVYEVSVDSEAWRIWRDAPDFSQRFTGTFADYGKKIDGLWQMSRDGVSWDDDLKITYQRQP